MSIAVAASALGRLPNDFSATWVSVGESQPWWSTRLFNLAQAGGIGLNQVVRKGPGAALLDMTFVCEAPFAVGVAKE